MALYIIGYVRTEPGRPEHPPITHYVIDHYCPYWDDPWYVSSEGDSYALATRSRLKTEIDQAMECVKEWLDRCHSKWRDSDSKYRREFFIQKVDR